MEEVVLLLLRVETVARIMTHLPSPCLNFQILLNLLTKVDSNRIGLKLADLKGNLSEVLNSQPLILLRIPMVTLLRVARGMVPTTLFANLDTSRSQLKR